MNLKHLSSCTQRRPDARILEPVPYIIPVADPEVAGDWVGNLFGRANPTHPIAALANLLTITIPTDCFYTLDSSCVYKPAAGGGGNNLLFQIRNEDDVVVWQLQSTWLAITAVGVVGTPYTPPQRLWLYKDWDVNWQCVNASAVGDEAAVSIALRMLYQ